MDPREPTPRSLHAEVASTGYPIRRARISLTTRILLMLVGVLVVILVILLLFTDTFIGQLSNRFADDTAQLSDQIAERSSTVLEEQSRKAYGVQASQQALSLDFVFTQVEAAVELLAHFGTLYSQPGYRSSVAALPSSAFADPARRPHRMVRDEARDIEVSWAYPMWHAPTGASGGAVRADVARYAALRDPMVALCQEQPHLVWAYAAFPSKALVLMPGNGLFADKPDFDPTARPWYRNAMEAAGDHTVWQAPYVDAASERLTVLESVAGDEDFEAYLVDRSGRVVYQSSYSWETSDWRQNFEPAEFTTATNEVDRQILSDMDALTAGVRRMNRPEGQRVVAYAPIPTVQWNLVLAFPNDALVSLQRQSEEEISDAFREAQKVTDRRFNELNKWFMAGIFGVYLVLMGLVTISLTRGFKQPINRIIEDIHVVSTGNLDHQVQHRSDDELGELANAFNEMTLQLRRTRNQLQEYNRTLETRVAERTAEVVQRNEELNELYKEAEQQYMKLKATQSQLIQQERMATLGQLVARIAHEINNPVNFLINSIRPLRQVIGKIENVLKLYESAEELAGEEAAARLRKIKLYKKQMRFENMLGDVESALELINAGADRTRQIVQNLRSFSRTEQGTYKPVDVRRGMDITVSLLAHHLKNRIEVTRDYDEVPDVECDPGKINQVFMNLLSNAAQAIEGEGTIHLAVKLTGKYVKIHIRDDGGGIPDENLYRIFEPFFTTKGETQGTGLGLAITHNIITEHGGTIEVRSKVGKGTEFIISLPIHQRTSEDSGSLDEESSVDTSPGITQQIPIYSGERVSVADDTDDMHWAGRQEPTIEETSGDPTPQQGAVPVDDPLGLNGDVPVRKKKKKKKKKKVRARRGEDEDSERSHDTLSQPSEDSDAKSTPTPRASRAVPDLRTDEGRVTGRYRIAPATEVPTTEEPAPAEQVDTEQPPPAEDGDDPAKSD